MKGQELVLRHWRVETRKLFQPEWFLKQTFLFNKVIYKGEATGFIFAIPGVLPWATDLISDKD